MLTWIASCDGSIADEELELLRGVAAAVPGGREVLPAVIDVARLARAEDLELACRFLRNNSDPAAKRLLAQLAVTMAVQDGFLTVSENHVLQFLADLLGLSARGFAKLFRDVAHRPFPVPGDPSAIEWWRRREAGEEARPPADEWGARHAAAGVSGAGDGTKKSPGAGTAGAAGAAAGGSASQRPMTRGKALLVLGVEAGASQDEIHSAYRRLAKARHPDRFAKLGPAAVAAATASFQRLQAAYEFLSTSAASEPASA